MLPHPIHCKPIIYIFLSRGLFYSKITILLNSSVDTYVRLDVHAFNQISPETAALTEILSNYIIIQTEIDSTFLNVCNIQYFFLNVCNIGWLAFSLFTTSSILLNCTKFFA